MSLARFRLADYDRHNAAPTNWRSACTGAPTNWTSACTFPQLLYVELCEELVYDTVFDTCLKSLVQRTTDIRSLENNNKNRPA